MLFVMRTWSLVRSLNRSLGGTTRQRLLIIAEHAAAGALEVDAADDERARTGPSTGNLATRSAVVMAVRRRWARLRMRLAVRLIDSLGAASVSLLRIAGLLRGWCKAIFDVSAASGVCTAALPGRGVTSLSEGSTASQKLLPPSKEKLREMG